MLSTHQEIEAVDARGGYQQPSKSLATNDERGPRAGAVFGGVGDVPRASIATQVCAHVRLRVRVY